MSCVWRNSMKKNNAAGPLVVSNQVQPAPAARKHPGATPSPRTSNIFRRWNLVVAHCRGFFSLVAGLVCLSRSSRILHSHFTPVQHAHFTHPWNADSHTLHLSSHPLSVQLLRAPPVPARPSPSPFPAAWAAPPGHRESLSTPPVRASMLCHSRAAATSLERVTSPLRSPDSQARCGGLSSCRRQDKKKMLP